MDGKREAAAWQDSMRGDVAKLTELLGRKPGLRVIQVGSRPDSTVYVEKKMEACAEIGVDCGVVRLPDSISQAALQAAVSAECAADAVDGVLVQLPLPPHLDEERVMECLDPRKDVDGFHPLNVGRMLARGIPPRFVPATPLGCIELLQRCNVSIPGKKAVILGDSNIVGMPLAMLLRDSGAATVTVCHRVTFTNLFAGSAVSDSSASRAIAAACLPQLPGPNCLNERGPRSYSWATLQPLDGGEERSSAARGGGAADLAGGAAAGVEVDVGASVDGHVAVSVKGRSDPTDMLRAVSTTLRDLRLDVADVQLQAAGGAVTGVFRAARAPGVAAPEAELDRIRSTLEARLRPPSAAPGSALGPGVTLEVLLDELPRITRDADILVVAVGYPELVKAEWVKDGAVVIDVGINVKPNSTADERRQGEAGPVAQRSALGSSATRHERRVFETDGATARCFTSQPPNGSPCKIVGDVAFEEVQHVASAITPVPGGVGPMTIAAVLHNVILAARYRTGLTVW